MIAVSDLISFAYLFGLGVFSALAASKSSPDARHRAAVFSLPVRKINPIKLLQYPPEML